MAARTASSRRAHTADGSWPRLVMSVAILGAVLALTIHAAPPWESMTIPTAETLRSVHFVDGHEGWAAGYNGTILHTGDGGTTWTPQVSGTTTDRFLAVRFLDADTGWAGAGRRVLRTTDGGTTWVDALADPSVYKFRNSLFPVSATQAWAPAVSVNVSPATRWFSRYTVQANGSVLEEDFNVVSSTSSFLDVYCPDPDNCWSVSSFGQIVRISNASAAVPSFAYQASGVTSSLNGVFMRDASTGWIVGNGGKILKTTDGGATWSPLTSGTTTNLRDVHFADVNNGWAVGESGLILATTDGGASWATQASGVTTTLWSVCFSGAGYAAGGDAAGGNGVLLRSAQGSGVANTVTTSPSGLSVTVDGETYTAPQTFNWAPGSSHTIAVASPQGGSETRHVFSAWSDGGAQDHTVVAPSSETTFTASFTTQHLLTTTVTPPEAGSVTPDCSGAGCWYDSGTNVDLHGIPGGGYFFSAWSGSVSSADNPFALLVDGPKAMTATFAPVVLLAVSIDDVTVTEGGSGTTSAVFTVTLSAPSPGVVSVAYATADGAATTADGDYQATSGTVTFQPGELQQTLVVAVNGDMKFEPAEDFFVNLSGPVNAVIGDGQGRGQILNDDPAVNPVPQVDVPLVPTSKPPGSAAFTLTIRGSNFSSSSVARWNHADRPTTVISPTEVRAEIAAADVESGGTAAVTVFTPAPGGGTSNAASFLVTGPMPATALSRADVATNGPPMSVAAGDLNGDGRPDVVAAIRDTNTISVLLGNGDGSFAAPVNLASSQGPFSVALGDMNGDGALDIVVTKLDSGNGAVTTMLGNGDGTFRAPASFSTRSGVYGLTLGDFNRDGKLDVATTNAGWNLVSILLGNGDGTLGSATTYPTNGTNPYIVVAADLNGDGILDLAAVNAWLSHSIAVLIGNGDGTFSGPTLVSTGGSDQALRLAAADLNADGRMDLIVSIPYDEIVIVLLGNGDGTFAEPNAFQVTWHPGVVSPGDFNADGNVDLAVGLADGVAIVLGNGDGTFGSPMKYSSAEYSQALALGDFNGDGKLDVVSVSATQAIVSVLLNNLPSIAVPDTAVVEGAGAGRNAVFTVRLSEPSAVPVTVHYTTADGTALAGSDYTASTGTVTFPPGSTTQTFSVPVIGDAVAEPNEQFVVNFSAPSNATLPDTQAAATILDDDAGEPTLLLPSGTYGYYYPGVQDIVGAMQLSVVVVGFYSFDVSALAMADPRGVSFSLVVQNIINPSFFPTTVSFWDVSTPVSDLWVTRWFYDPIIDTIASDLASGAQFGTLQVENTPGQGYQVALNALALDDLKAALSSGRQYFSLGLTTSVYGAGFSPQAGSGRLTMTFEAPPKAPAVPSPADGAVDVPMSPTLGWTGGDPNPADAVTYDLYFGTAADPPLLAGGLASTTHPVGPLAGSTTYYWRIVARDPSGATTNGPMWSFTTQVLIPPHVTSTTPLLNAVNVPRGANVRVTFDSPMLASSLNSQTFRVHGSVHGLYAGTFSYDDPTRTATFDPSVSFAAGEELTAIVTTGATSANGVPLAAGRVFRFGAAVDAGHGTFKPMGTATGISHPWFVAAADLDGDGDLDLVTPDHSYVWVLLNNGDGTFAPPVSYVANQSDVSWLSLADMDGDGDVDIVSSSARMNQVSLLRNNGDGTFAYMETYNLFVYIPTSAVGDLDGDGDLDIVAMPGKLLTNNGNGVFTVTGGMGTADGHAVIADVDGDGDLDVISAFSWLAELQLNRNQGSGTFSNEYFDISVVAGSVLAIDVDGDRDVDLVIGDANAAQFQVYVNNGSGTFTAGAVYPLPDLPRHIASCDVDADGDLDLVVSSGNVVSVFANDGTGTFGTPAEYPTSAPYVLACGDFNGDGKPDLAVPNADSDTITLFMNAAQNEPPVADAGPDRTVEAGSLVTLDGSGSSDPDSDHLSYAWSQSGGPAVVLSPNGARATFTPVGTGTYIFRLDVNDGRGGTASDTVQIVVQDTTGPAVTVTSPNGGEKIFMSAPYPITWTASDNGAIGFFDVFYSTNGGTVFSPVPGCSGVSGAARSCTWAVPGPSTSTGRIRVTAHDASGNIGLDASDANHSVTALAAAITVTKPTTLLTWVIGSSQQIKWSHNLGVNSSVRIEVSRDAGLTWEVLSASFKHTASTSGTFDWVVTGPPTVHGLVRVAWLGGPTSDTSDLAFTVVNPTVTVTQPNSALSWVVGATQQIRWSHNAGLGSTYRIELSRDGGVTFPELLAAAAPATASTSAIFNWTVSGPPSTLARVRVTLTTNPAARGASAVDFKIVNPTVTVTQPNSAVSWVVGTAQQIKWSHNAGLGSTFRIELSRDGGVTFPEQLVAAAPATASTSGIFNWTVSGAASALARVRVTLTTNPAATDTSNVDFKIVVPTVTVTQPNTALNWAVGVPQQIKWSHNGGLTATFTVEVSRDGGASWELLTASAPATASTSSVFNWVVTGPVTSAGRVRVTWNACPIGTDISNVNFTIAEPYITLSSPTAAVSWGYASVQTVTWSTNLGSGDQVNVVMSTDGGVSFPITLASNVTASLKTVKVATPTLPAPTTLARVRVERVATPAVGGTNPANFKVESPFIAVTKPNGPSNIWTIGTTQTIYWTHNLSTTENVMIELSQDGGATYPILLYAGTPCDKAQSVVVQSGWATRQGRVRITWLRNGAVTDVSDLDFPIQ